MKVTKIIFLITLLTLILLPSQPILADGIVIRPDPYGNRWDYSTETNQQAFINYEDGLQKMIISVGLENAEEEAVWIFPVPAEPEEVVIDVVTALPQLRGEEITQAAKSELFDIKRLLQYSQVYPYFFISRYRSVMSRASSSGKFTEDLGLAAGSQAVEEDVIVHEHLEKEGLVTEIVTAQNGDALYDYLEEKNLDLEKGSIPVLDHYTGKDYTFVVSWLNQGENNEPLITNSQYRNERKEKLIEIIALNYLNLDLNDLSIDWNKLYQFEKDDLIKIIAELKTKSQSERARIAASLKIGQPSLLAPPTVKKVYYPERKDSNQRGVFVTFPTRKIYYPLLPTSVYGSEVVPATLRIIDLVKPKIFKDIKTYTKAQYYQNAYLGNLDSELDNFYTQDKKRVNYTKVEINAPSKMLTKDLWISKHAPLKILKALFIARHPHASSIILLILLSIITSILTGLLIFRNFRKPKGILKLAMLGLFNCLSLIIFMIAVVFVSTKELREEDKNLILELKQRGYSTLGLGRKDWKKLIFIPLFSVLFLAFSWLVIKFIEWFL